MGRSFVVPVHEDLAMTQRPEHGPNHSFPEQGRGPLPSSFEADLQDVDALLREHARRVDVPRGLEDRVFEASVSNLAGPSIGERRTAVIGVERFRLDRWRKRWGGRVAIAASLGMVFVLAALFLSLPTPTDGPAGGFRLASDLNAGWLEEDPRDHEDAYLAYLLDSATISSFDEITGEIEAIVSDYEM
jgi:hypothetical protein